MSNSFDAVILYGPPAAGKDTITRRLTEIDRRYAPYERMKVGSGNTTGYRMITADQLRDLREAGEVVYLNTRYGNTYVVDRPHVVSQLEDGQIPILHLGQVDGVAAVRRVPARWLAVLLWCSRQTTDARSRLRGSKDVEARLAAWDETSEELERMGEAAFDIRIDTDVVTASRAAEIIDGWVFGMDAPRGETGQ